MSVKSALARCETWPTTSGKCAVRMHDSDALTRKGVELLNGKSEGYDDESSG